MVQQVRHGVILIMLLFSLFHPNHSYDDLYTDQQVLYKTTRTDVPKHSVEEYQYLEGTDDFDPDDGLLFKVFNRC